MASLTVLVSSFFVVITSSIVSMDAIYNEYLGLMMKEEGYGSSRWIPCYRALDNGWNVSTFHRLCDDKGPTMTIIRKNDNVFGGFTERRWREGTSWKFFFGWPSFKIAIVESFIRTIKNTPKEKKHPKKLV